MPSIIPSIIKPIKATPAVSTPIYLAPMEGVVDSHMRHLLTRLGGIDYCVTEFVRVTHTKLPPKVFHRFCPELTTQGKTQAGINVSVQLLGSDPECLALNAQRAAELGAPAIDLNFGCPAKTVNRHRGGACLLQEPELIYHIVKAVREAVDPSIPVTAKIRLGFNDRSRYLDNALAIESAGATELAVHARSKQDGYKPPAYWEYVRDINESLGIKVIANGEVWSVKDYRRCREVSGCDDIMIGRGLISCPDLGLQIKADSQGYEYQPLSWPYICTLLFELLNRDVLVALQHEDTSKVDRFSTSRLKQWLVYLKRQYPEATECFDMIKRHKTVAAIKPLLLASINPEADQWFKATYSATKVSESPAVGLSTKADFLLQDEVQTPLQTAPVGG